MRKKDWPELFFYPAGSWGPEAADDCSLVTVGPGGDYDHAAIAETYSLGLPVEVSKIDPELKKLWQEKRKRHSRFTH